MAENGLRSVLWEWNVYVHDFRHQVEAAAAGGFDVLTMPLRKYRAETAAGLTARDMLAIAADHGTEIDFLDGFSGWAPVRYPAGADDFLRMALDFSVEEALDVCASLGLRNIVAIGAFDQGAVSETALVDAFGDFCERAAKADIHVDLEPMAMVQGIPNLRCAWDIVRQAAQPNAGVMIDSWHFMRCGTDFELLASLPRGTVVNVQLADGTTKPFGETLWQDAMGHRLLPGEGELPLVRILETLKRTQNLETVGPEAISDALNQLSVVEAGRAAARATAATLSAASLCCPLKTG